MMLKFINMEETPVWFKLSELEELDEDANPQDDNEVKELTHSCKIKTSQKLNCTIDLPKD